MKLTESKSIFEYLFSLSKSAIFAIALIVWGLSFLAQGFGLPISYTGEMPWFEVKRVEEEDLLWYRLIGITLVGAGLLGFMKPASLPLIGKKEIVFRSEMAIDRSSLKRIVGSHARKPPNVKWPKNTEALLDSATEVREAHGISGLHFADEAQVRSDLDRAARVLDNRKEIVERIPDIVKRMQSNFSQEEIEDALVSYLLLSNFNVHVDMAYFLANSKDAVALGAEVPDVWKKFLNQSSTQTLAAIVGRPGDTDFVACKIDGDRHIIMDPRGGHLTIFLPKASIEHHDGNTIARLAIPQVEQLGAGANVAVNGSYETRWPLIDWSD